MSIITFIFAVIIGIIVWAIYHQLFSVAYFGCEAMLVEVIICFVIGIVVVNFIGGFLRNLFGGIVGIFPIVIGIVVVIGIITAIVKAVK